MRTTIEIIQISVGCLQISHDLQDNDFFVLKMREPSPPDHGHGRAARSPELMLLGDSGHGGSM
jgi:hypothetical protein